MKALILAAGRGTRIRSVHGERPKCLISIDGTDSTILDQQIGSLFAAGVREIGIVVGYEKDQIIDYVKRNYTHCLRRFRFFVNPRYMETNNIYSLWIARDWVQDDAFVVLNADVVFDSSALLRALLSPTPVTMIVDPEWRDETMKVVAVNGRIIRMSKGIPREEFSGTYIGITAFSEAIQARFIGKLDAMIQAGRVNDFFNVAVQELADEGVPVGLASSAGLPWAEIDDPGDLTFAQQHVFPQLTGTAAAA